MPGKFHGQRNLASYNPWGCKELATTSTSACNLETVQMNLFTEKKWRHRRREWTVDTAGEEEVGQMEKVALTCIHHYV